MSNARIMDLVDAASAAALDEAGASARASTLKAAAVAEGERIRLEVGVADRFTSEQGLGVLRLDGANKPAVCRVEKPTEFADWLAQRQPHLVRATITVPAAQLEDALTALNFATVDVAGAEVKPTSEAEGWMREHCHPVADPESPGGWYVRTITADGTEVVPGVGASKPAPRWVLAPNQDLKRARAQEAEDEARAELHPEEAVPEAPVPAVEVSTPRPAPAADPILYTDLTAVLRDDLVARCKSAGLPITGTKATLAARLNVAIGG